MDVIGSGVMVSVTVDLVPQLVTTEVTVWEEHFVFVGRADGLPRAGLYFVMHVWVLAMEVDVSA